MAEITKPLSDPDSIVKRVWDTDDIDIKTDLSEIQIEKINKLDTLSHVFGSPILNQHLNEFMRLRKSKDRKSMGEFVDALRSKKAEILEKAKNFHLLG